MSASRVKGDRFWAKVRFGDWLDCWSWTGALTDKGYGSFRVGSRALGAHRLVYEMLVGPIPEGLVLDHVKAWGCKARSCVNPLHLEPVTSGENTLRGETLTAANLAKTRCPDGHEYTPENTYIRPGKTWRDCRTCRKEGSSGRGRL